MCARSVIVMLVSFGFGVTAVGQTPVTSTWQDDTGTWDGTWNETVHWDVLGGSDTYPDNNASYEYDVFLPTAGLSYIVAVGSPEVVLTSLDLHADATLRLSSTDFKPGSLTNAGVIEVRNDDLILETDVLNNGTIQFDTDTGSEDIDIVSDVTLSGTGRVFFPDTGTGTTSYHQLVVSPLRTLTNGVGHTIEGGAGEVYGGAYNNTSYFVNDGVVSANVVNRTLAVVGYYPHRMGATNNNQMSALNGGTLRLYVSFTNEGVLTVDGSSTMRLEYGSTVRGTVDNDGLLVGSSNVSFIGTSGQGTGEYRQTAETVTFDGTATVEFGMVSIQSSGRITVEDNGLVTVADAYTHTMTNETYHNFNVTGALRVTGGTTAGPADYDQFASIEIGGEDLGTDPANHYGDPQGFTNNFHLPRLLIAPGAKMNLIDEINNGNRCGVGGAAEALYVDSLEFEDANGVLNLNGLHLYYNNFVGDPSQIVDSGGQSAGGVTSTWTCQSGDWESFFCWDQLQSGDDYPNNDFIASYQVLLGSNGGTPYTVSVTLGPIELCGLDIDSDATLQLDSTDFNPGSLTNAGVIEVRNDDLILETDVLNNGTIQFDTDTGSEDIDIVSDVTLNGTGRVFFPDTGTDTTSYHQLVVSPLRTLTNGVGHTIEGGAGEVYGGDYSNTSYFVNDGLVSANVVNRTLAVVGYYPHRMGATNNNQMSALNGGTLRLYVSFTNEGVLTVDDSSTMKLEYTSTVRGTVDNDGLLIGASDVSFVGTSGQGTGEYRQTAGTVTFDGTATVGFGMVSIQSSGRITVEDGGLVTVIDAYTHTMTNESYHNFNVTGALRVTGGMTAGPTDYEQFANIEIAGEDLGTDPASHYGDPQGFINNFHLPRLLIAPGAKMNLIDEINNGNRCGVGGAAEALYVDSLEFEDANGVLNLNGLHLYYNNFVGDPSQIVDSGGQSAGGVTSTWTCQSGDWESFFCWDQLQSGDDYPNNDFIASYQVLLGSNGGTPYTVSVTLGPIELCGLDIDSDATLQLDSTDFNPGSLTNAGVIEVRNDDLILETDVLNNGTIQFDTDTGSEDIDIVSDVTLSGTGRVFFPDTGTGTTSYHQLVVSPLRTLTNGVGHTIEGGAGEVYGGAYNNTSYFVNDGVVSANVVNRTLAVVGYYPHRMGATNNNQMSALNGGTLRLYVSFTNEGVLTVDGSSTMRLEYGSTVRGTVDNDGLLIGASDVSFVGTSGQGTGEYRQTAGTVTFDGTATVEFGMVSIQSSGRITVEDNGLVTVADAYTHTMTNETYHNFNVTGALRVTGGIGGDACDIETLARIEVAGEDLGDDPAGYVNNFHLPRLVIGSGAKVALVDEIDNGNWGGVGGDAEALYVDTIEFEDGAGLLRPTASIHVYYNNLVGSADQIIPGTDCNTNDVPDDCDIAGGTSLDCNDNSVPDECDIAQGTSPDNDGDGIPDECAFIPTASGDGCRYIGVTPAAGVDPIALWVQGDPADPRVDCVAAYVQADGTLDTTAVFQTPSVWGTVYVGDQEVMEGARYSIQADSGTPSDPPLSLPAYATTLPWGDLNDDALVNGYDLLIFVDAYRTDLPYWIGDLCPEVPDELVNGVDLLCWIDAYLSQPYPFWDCLGRAAGARGGGDGEPRALAGLSKVVLTVKPETGWARPGRPVSVNVFLEGAEDVRLYEVAMDVVGGDSGNLVLDDIFIDEDRRDFVFADYSPVSIDDPGQQRAVSALWEGGESTVGWPRYLATFVFVPSRNARGVFKLIPRDEPGTMLRDSMNQPIVISESGAATIKVGKWRKARRSSVRNP